MRDGGMRRPGAAGAKRLVRIAFVAVIVAAWSFEMSGISLAAFGTPLSQCTPAFSGNGRAVAFNPSTQLLYWTNTSAFGDTHIYVTGPVTGPTPSCTPTVALVTTPAINFGALSWDPNRGVLWGGAYGPFFPSTAAVPGGIYQICVTASLICPTPPPSGTATVVGPVFTLPAAGLDSCYGAGAAGFIDGLAYDGTTDSLWISGDAARTIYHTATTPGPVVLGTFPVPTTPGGCNTGIAVDGNQFLWLGAQSGADTPPHFIVKVAKTNPSVALASFVYSTSNPGPEGLALDLVTFAPKCALWTNQFAQAVLTAWDLASESQSCSVTAIRATGGGDFTNASGVIANFGMTIRAPGSGHVEFNVKNGMTFHCVVTFATGTGATDMDYTCNDQNGAPHSGHLHDGGNGSGSGDSFTFDAFGGVLTHGNVTVHTK